MTNEKKMEWLLRIGVAGEFAGHGVFALQGKKDWIKWTQQLSGMDASMATTFIFVVGVVDILLAISVLVKPIRPLLLWMAFWGFWTALVRPLSACQFGFYWWANWAAPLALFYLYRGKGK